MLAPAVRGSPAWSISTMSIQVNGGSVFSNDEKKPRTVIRDAPRTVRQASDPIEVPSVVENAAMDTARRLWLTVEPLHDVIYFAPGIRDSGKAIGLRGYWMTYFAYRAAPLGPVGPGPVIATFAGFEPSMVAKALPDAWTRATPAACLYARLPAAVEGLRLAEVDEDACARAVALLAPAMAAADATGRALFAANAQLPLS